MKKISGGHLVAEMLHQEGVEKVFGIIDGTYFGLYSSLRKYGIQLITPRHETSAAHMAGAYARLTGKLGVCIASNGPGVANILPGVAVENGEGNRILVITSCRRVGLMYPDRVGTYQGFNQVGVISAMAKSSEAILQFRRIPEVFRRAFRKSYQGRPGVVHVDIPEDIVNGSDKFPHTWKTNQYRNVEPLLPSPKQVEEAANLLVQAKFPILHVGSGAVHSLAFDEVKKVAELLHAPVTTSWGARGVIPETEELSIPMIHVELNHKIRNASDLVLTVGSRMGETDWWGKPPYWASPSRQKMIQVDTDETILGAHKPVELGIVADAKMFLQMLAEKLEGMKSKIDFSSRKSQVAKFKALQKKDRNKLDESLQDMSSPMHPAHVATVCQQVFPEDVILILDGGNTAIWGNFYFQVKKPNQVVSTFKFGMLGAGVSQALGAAVAFPNRKVCCIIGDGAMGFHPQEIETAVRNKLNVVYVVCCDKQWGMVKLGQQFALRPLKTLLKKSLPPSETINADLGEIEFDKLSMSMGGHGERISNAKDLKPALERALAANKCAVVHVDVNPVKHMWAPGLMHFKKMHQEPEGE